MPRERNREVHPHASPRRVVGQDGSILAVPEDWDFLPAGDAGLTRRVKAAGPTWTVKQKRGRRIISLGIWASAASIRRETLQLEQERATPAYQHRLDAGRERRAKEQRLYAISFRSSVFKYLNFHPRYQEMSGRLATLIAEHATPVGSGTVARTERIPIEERAEAATIAWMRHQTTRYDNMSIARVKGERRAVRRQLAQVSIKLLEAYRQGGDIPPDCPLAKALQA